MSRIVKLDNNVLSEKQRLLHEDTYKNQTLRCTQRREEKMARIENGGIIWWVIEWKEEGIACMCIQKPNPNMYPEKGRREGKGEMARIENHGIV